VRCNPVLFKIPEVMDDSKENQAPQTARKPSLPYRSVLSVLTWDSVVIYDTYHSQPLAIIRGLHYANLVDAVWAVDGHHLIVCSTDGYISIITFAPGELGEVYKSPTVETPIEQQSTSCTAPVEPSRPVNLPPCEPGEVNILQARPVKRAKTTEGPLVNTKRPATDEVGEAVHNLTLEHKKKKRIQPILLSSTTL
jgi:chromatin assembly factor 1 subunit B